MKMLPILVLASSLASASASAVTIDSPEVGQFFKLPSWAPAAVDSEHTPGSPETVVDVYSNAVKTTEWEFGAIRWFPSNSYYAVSFSPTNAVQPTYVKGRGWDLSASLESLARIVPRSEGSNSYSAPGGSVVAADEGAGSLTISVHYSATRQVNGQWYSITTDFNWTLTAAKQEVEPVNTGRKAVRPVRLVPEMFSSLYATFEAYYERLYYTSCGSRNVWDVSEWGPRNPDHLFWFGSTNWYHSSFYEPQTNRTVRTRRLVEFDNLVRMYGWIRDMPAWYRPERPSWSNYHNSAFISTTVFDDMGLTVPWPDMRSWGSPENTLTRLTSGQWERTMLTFEDVRKAVPDPDRDYQLDWTSGGDWSSNARGAWDTVNFGEPPFSVPDVYDRMLRQKFTDAEKSVSNTTEEVLAYPWGDRSLITNDFVETRRLIPDSWGRANQVLACYDRSFYGPPFENMCATGTYQRAEQERVYGGASSGGPAVVVGVGGRFYGGLGEEVYALATGSASIPVPDGQATYSHTNVDSVAVSRQFPVAYSSPTDVGGSVHLDESLYFHPDDLWVFLPLRDVLPEIAALPSPDGEFEFYPGEVYNYIGLSIDGAAMFSHSTGVYDGTRTWYIDGTIGFYPRPFVADFGVTYSMRKSHENVQVSGLDRSSVGDPVPGDFSRILPGGEGCSLYFLLSSAVGTGKDGSLVFADVPVPSPLSYYEFMHGSYRRDADQWASWYMACTSGYGTGAGYVDAIAEAYSRVWGKCSASVDSAGLGGNWRDSVAMADIGVTDVVGVFGGLSITNGTKLGWHFENRGANNHVDLPDSPWPNQILISCLVRKEPGEPDFTIVRLTCLDVASSYVFDVDDEESIAQARLQTFAEWFSLEVPGNAVKTSPGAVSDGKVWGMSRVDWNWNCLRLNKDE